MRDNWKSRLGKWKYQKVNIRSESEPRDENPNLVERRKIGFFPRFSTTRNCSLRLVLVFKTARENPRLHVPGLLIVELSGAR